MLIIAALKFGFNLGNIQDESAMQDQDKYCREKNNKKTTLLPAAVQQHCS